ncbi:MAG: FdtA/QdtA family cupin domain-containing protein [Proteobacteria bacterium]|nr:FdtA/QdtA family cupin domain-containing protein [Pseudomonadota bacterium]
MAHILELPTHTDSRGSLTFLQNTLPFTIQRVFWIYDLNTQPRGQHRHKLNWQAMICLQGKCEVLIKKNQQEEIFFLNKPNELLILAPEDWHEMRKFEENPILLVLASHEYDSKDYLSEPL